MMTIIHKIRSYLSRRINYLFHKKRRIIDFQRENIQYKGRIEEAVPQELNGFDIVLTTYFATKADPQSKAFIPQNDFSYIASVYQSAIKLGLNTVIFHDHLSAGFVSNYTCKNVTFIKCRISRYSLNDERFFIYKEFIEEAKPAKVVLSDGSDVIFNKNPFAFINCERLYIGRDVHLLIADHSWILNKIKLLPDDIKSRISGLFMTMPIVNAGVIGGDYQTIHSFLQKLCFLLAQLDNDNNNNMAAVNVIFYDEYWLGYHSSLVNKLKYLRTAHLTTLRTSRSLASKRFLMGRPFTSEFKKYQNDEHVFIWHK